MILHIGLHKTGTRYLQRDVFGRLDGQRFAVNPTPLWPAVRRAVREPDNAEAADAARQTVADWRASGDDRTLVLSEPHISGDMYGNHFDHADNARLMRELFPEAEIVYFVRNQADWLQSAYRQQLWRGASVPVHVFLNHYHGRFEPRGDRWAYGARTVEALNQRFLAIHQTYAELFGPERVHLFRQEDLRRRGDAVRRCLAGVLGVDALPDAPAGGSHNRSYSALAIRLFHPMTLRRLGPPPPHRLGPPRRRLPWLRGRLRRLRRVLVQHVFDRLIYKDWDLLAHDDLRARIDQHYAGENKAIADIAERTLQRAATDGPDAMAEHRGATGSSDRTSSAT